MEKPAQKRRRLAVLVNDMNAAGGIQRVAVHLVGLLGARYDARLLTVEALETPVFSEAGIPFHSLNCPRVHKGRLGYLWELVRIGRTLRRYILRERIEILLCIWYDWSSVAAWALPASVIKIGCEHIAFEEAPRFWRLMRRLSYPRLHGVVGLTQADRPALAQIAKRVWIIPNGVPLQKAQEIPREPILLSVGHLIPRKGFDRLLWALQAPLHAHPHWKLVFVGGGEQGHSDWSYLGYLADLIRLLQLEGQVVLCPATQDIDRWYRRASCYVMGSRQEGLPMVLIEAKAYGLPIVSFDCPTGPREILRPEIDGFLVSGNSQAFGSAVQQLMEDEDLRQRMGQAAWEDVQARFSLEAIAQQWFDLLESLTG